MNTLQLADGRTLEYLVTGPADGIPLILHNGTPSAAMFFAPMAETVTARGLRFVVYNRPGYAASSAQPGRTVASAADDVAALLDELGADRFFTVGWSGGGPHALACAALLPGRCIAAATLAGVAPYSADGLDWLDGMAAPNIAEFEAAVAGEAALTAFLGAVTPGMAAVQGDQIAAALGELVPEVDRKVLTDRFADYMAASLRGALAGGIAGWRDDDLAFVRDWGFDPAAVGVPVAVWQGGQDRMVPFAHGRWLGGRLPGAAVHLEPDEGHLSLVLNGFDDIVAELTAHLA